MPNLPTIPEFITVHLGPPDQPAENITLPFLDYIANVASSEIYPSWPENAIRANLYAQISLALNRIYTEHYRTRGYDFDITNSKETDQSFVNGRNIFNNFRELAGELLNNYIRREGSMEPFFAQHCNGTSVTCEGLSQWGSVELADQGYTPYEILQHYYGDRISLVQDAPVAGSGSNAPSLPLRLGSVGDDVRTIQIRLNRISDNYPSIPEIPQADGIFDAATEAAVKRFQEIFSLPPDGVVRKATWHTIQNIYLGITRLTDLNAEGTPISGTTSQYPSVTSLGSTGIGVQYLQYFLNNLSQFYNTIPPVTVDGIYGQATKNAVEAAQRTFGLTVDGIAGEDTWNAIYRAYRGIVDTIPPQFVESSTIPYRGNPLRIGSDSEDVRLLQEYLNFIAQTYSEIPAVNPTGYFGPRTQEAVIAFQNEADLPATGIVEAATWTEIAKLYDLLFRGAQLGEGQYPGFELGA